MFYYLTAAIDKNSETDLTLFRYAFPDVKGLSEFSDSREKNGLDASLMLLKNIQYHWVKGTVNQIGDILGGNLFSIRAAELIRSFRGDYHFFEPINIEGTPAYHISPKRVADLSDEWDIFRSETHRRAIIVSDRLKAAWESAGLLGAEFDDVMRPGKY